MATHVDEAVLPENCVMNIGSHWASLGHFTSANVTKQKIAVEEVLDILKSVLPPFQRAHKDLSAWAVD